MTFGKMTVRQRRLMAGVILASVALVGLAAHAAFTTLTDDTASQSAGTQLNTSRVALVIGNSNYPDADAPLSQPVNDSRALAAALRKDGYHVDALENATRSEMLKAVERLKNRVGKDTVALVYFGGYGIASRRENFLIPVDASIWSERDVRRDGLRLETLLETIEENGAKAKLVVLDAARRNPYERRFRTFSQGLAPMKVPANAVILSSTADGQMTDNQPLRHSAMISQLIKQLDTQASVEVIFRNTRNAVHEETNGALTPVVSSSLAEVIKLGPGQASSADAGG